MAAFEGALCYHPDYADVHYHLARTLDEIQPAPTGPTSIGGRFLDLAPDSPWAEAAKART